MSEIKKKYVILGDPIPLLRARFGKRTCWDSQKQQKLVDGMNIASQHEGRLYEGPLHLDAAFYFAVPKARLNKKESVWGTPHIFKPDLSNLLKYIEDTVTGILFKDDCIIASITTQKIYGDTPRTEFTITELSNEVNKNDK